MAATPPWLASAEAMLNRNIGASSQAAMLARRLNGTAMQLAVSGFTRIRATVTHGRLALLGADDAPADTSIEGSPPALLALLRGGAIPAGDNDARRSNVRISGDAEIANLYKQLFAAARPDLEEELSRFVGDLPARSIARVARELEGWLRRARRTAEENIAEYLTEESRDLPAQAEVDDFLEGVDRVREGVDRIEARIVALERRAGGT